MAEAEAKAAAEAIEEGVKAVAIRDGEPKAEAGAGAAAADPGPSKSAAKKDAKAAKKAERLAARQQQQQAASAKGEEDDPLAGKAYGDLPMEAVQSSQVSGRHWTKVAELDESKVGQVALVRGRVHSVRGKGKLGFLILREGGHTVQCVLAVSAGPDSAPARGGSESAGEGEGTADGAAAGQGFVSKGMVKYATGLSNETVAEVEGLLVRPALPVESCTQQQVELHLRSVHAVSRAAPALPLSIEDAARSEADIEEGLKEGKQYVRVLQDTRLNNRVLDLRTPANQAIFRLQSATGLLFREYLISQGFIEIHSPKLIGGSSEGGAAVFRLDYKGRPACLAQSPQLYKQMAICADLGRVFEIGPVFRAEDSFTHRHLCEFTGLDFEMEIKEHYFEVLDVIENLFLHIFDGLSQRPTDLAAVNAQYPFEPLQYPRKGVRITFAEGVAMLQEAGLAVDPFGDINTEQEKKLGELVKAKFKTDFYIMHRYPLVVRPFYTMPCPDDPRYSNSFDVFIRGEEIISGAQRVHDPDLLTERAKACGIDVASIASYIESFRFGAVPHGGVGVGLERVVMLFLGLNNIRKVSMFPRDPQRLTP